MDNTRFEARPLRDALLSSAAEDVMLLCGRGLSESEVDALLAWQTSDARSGPRTLTLVKSPTRAACDLLIRLLSSSTMWVIYPVPPADPELRLRCESPALRVRVVSGSRRSTLELTALANGSLLHRV